MTASVESGGPGSSSPPVPEEGTLVDVWRAVLRNPDLDAETSFFDAGGTSLTAVRLRAALRESCGIDVDLLVLVENPSPAELSVALEEAESEA